MKLKTRKDFRRRRHLRIRRKVFGTAERPRMAIMISNRHMYVQFIDDDRGVTLASASTLGRNEGHNLTAAEALGRRAAEAALQKGIRLVVVDRGGFRFHGRVKRIVDAAVAAGLSISTKKDASNAEPGTGSPTSVESAKVDRTVSVPKGNKTEET